MIAYSFKFFIKFKLICVLIIITYSSVFSQIDTLIFKNDNIIVGEIKSMDKGIVQIETDYSDRDFKIEWNEVKEVYTETLFLVILSDDDMNYFGRLSSTSGSKVNILTEDSTVVECEINNIVFLSPFEKGFFDRLYASIDLSLSLTKAENLHQLTSHSTIGYRAKKWNTDLSFNSLWSTQDDIEQIKRNEVILNYLYFLPRQWFSIATISLLSNTEQKLDLRTNAQIGMGRFIIRTNFAYWGVKLGVNRNIETYSNETVDRSSWEGYLGTELNLFDIGDFSLLTIVMAYPSFTEKGRWRLDSNLDIKYDLPYDFYIKVGVSSNYDNHPAEGASETDYILQSGFGWEW